MLIPALSIDVHLDSSAIAASLAHDVKDGLTRPQKQLPPKWFYDDRGSQLFDAITRLAEYYPTSRERAILREHAGDIVELSTADTLVELGSGTSEKTRILLDAFYGDHSFMSFVPFDVSERTLRASAEAIRQRYPRLSVHGVVGDFDHHLHLLPRGGRTLTAFLGGTIGNFDPGERAKLLAELTADFRPGDTMLLGTDLVKDERRLLLAYDDPAGITALFNKNVLAVLNRELDATFNLECFDHLARYDRQNAWIEMHLVASRQQEVNVNSLDLRVAFAAGETILTEISAKFRRTTVEAELAAAGLRLLAWWTDTDGDFALSLAVRD